MHARARTSRRFARVGVLRQHEGRQDADVWHADLRRAGRLEAGQHRQAALRRRRARRVLQVAPREGRGLQGPPQLNRPGAVQGGDAVRAQAMRDRAGDPADVRAPRHGHVPLRGRGHVRGGPHQEAQGAPLPLRTSALLGDPEQHQALARDRAPAGAPAGAEGVLHGRQRAQGQLRGARAGGADGALAGAAEPRLQLAAEARPVKRR
eukprot:CAMPEP_0175570206 /NCGR_PEP_ID=MMETSP0096-20121207/41874_1 /TAXON_ID=311494 /ORGANISM="Alexandrium monilatum, Strain CCMP3105" /LENGTH=206 /DNA_ID=CAMNT_0016873585 /DNA_START=81 /DNA_END=697 /DNA_ORIENTATION=+